MFIDSRFTRSSCCVASKVHADADADADEGDDQWLAVLGLKRFQETTEYLGNREVSRPPTPTECREEGGSSHHPALGGPRF
jgi:hypothetical protein